MFWCNRHLHGAYMNSVKMHSYKIVLQQLYISNVQVVDKINSKGDNLLLTMNYTTILY